MNVAVIQTHGTSDIAANKAQAAKLVEQSAGDGASLVLFPEMSVLEFFPRIAHNYDYFDLAEPIPGETMDFFADLARRHGVHIVYNHYERSPEGLYFDASVVLDAKGSYVGRQRMMHTAEEPGYNEKFYYTPGWDRYHVFELDAWRFGIAICYDRHFPEVFRSFILSGAQLVLVPTAVAASEPFADVYEMEMRAAAVTHGVYIAMANRSGREDPLQFLGRSMIIDPMGNVVASLKDEPNKTLTVELSQEKVIKARQLFPFLRDRRPETYGAVARIPDGGDIKRTH